MFQGAWPPGRLLAGLVGLALLAACGGGGEAPSADGADGETRELVLAAGADTRLGGVAEIRAGDAVTLGQDGSLVARRPGTAQVVVRETAAETLLQVRVPQPDAVILALEADPDSLLVGERYGVHLWAETGGERHDVGAFARWSVAAGDADWDPAGRTVTPTAPGPLTLQAQWGGAVHTLSLRADDPVTAYRLQADESATPWPAGETRTFTLLVERRSGAVGPPPADFDPQRLDSSGPLAWRWIDGGRLELTPTAAGAGALTLEGGTLGAWTFAPPPWVALALFASAQDPAVGESVRLTAVASDALGGEAEVTDRIQWAVDGEVLAHQGGGVFRVLAAGRTQVQAAFEDLRASLDLSLAPPRLTAIELGPAPAAVLPGEAVRLTVNGRFSDGQTRPLDGVAWLSDDEQVVAVTETGLQALGPGTATVRARLDGVESGPLTVAVAEGLRIQPEQVDLNAAESLRLSAQAVYPDRQVEVNDRVGWTSGDAEVAQVDGGAVLALTPGRVTIDTRPPAAQAAQVTVHPRPVLDGAGSHTLQAADFARTADGRWVAALGVSALAPGALYTARVDDLPPGSLMTLVPVPEDGRYGFNQGQGGPLGCSLRAGGDGGLTVLLIADATLTPGGQTLTVAAGGFEDEGDLAAPVPLVLGVPHAGSVASLGTSRYRVGMNGAASYRLTVDAVEGGPVQLRLEGAAGDCPTLIEGAGAPFTCTFLPDPPAAPSVDLVMDGGFTPAPEGGTRYRLLVEALPAP